ncbi:MAG: carbohydrate binding family 9 domain-containing protein [Gemmatimonadetes bacterium]|nr:carbohydrate binding family 9 domain-containing protein [Gemmatimonadota bacterium]
MPTPIGTIAAIRALTVLAVCGALSSRPATAQSAGAATPRTSNRRLTATATTSAVKVDGVLDDAVWQTAAIAKDFVQSEPRTGEPASERTEVRVAFDADNLYVAAYLYDSDPSHIVVNEIRKDFREDDQDSFEVILDTFRDKRNGYVFITNAEGAKADRQVANEGRETNTSWDAVWYVKTRRVNDGWTVEMAIPFRALRFDPASDGTWGINFSRRIRRRFETTFWSPIPREFNLARLSLAGELTGVRPERASRDTRVKPYALGRSNRVLGKSPFTSTGDVGVDAKIGVTRALALDLTVNPDFAQVEADELQVNLTQFSQFFPEKREFFLENSGTFYVGDAARNNRVFMPPTADEDMLLFFSRRIGLTSSAQPVTIPVGGRLTGTAGGFGIGAMSMLTERAGSTPANLYNAMRLRRNVGNGSDIGLIYMSRDATDSTDDYNRVYGLDANVRFFRKLDWNSFAVLSDSPDKTSGEYTWRTSLNWEGPFLHVKAAEMHIGDGFDNDLGFYRRTGVRKHFLDAGVRPRWKWWRDRGVREIHPHLTWNYYEDFAGNTIGKNLHTGNSWFFVNGGFIEISVNPKYEFLRDSLRLNRGNPKAQRLAPGGYQWTDWMVRGTTDASRKVALNYSVAWGGLWSGTQSTVNGTVTVRPSYKLRLSVGSQHSRITLDKPKDEFDATVWTGRVNYSFTTNMFLDALSQYDMATRQVNSNIRFNVIHRPLSDLFIVFNENRFTTPDAPIPGRSLVLKFTQMMAF